MNSYPRYTNELFAERFVPDEKAIRYELIEEIKSVKSRIRVFCSCGSNYETTINNFVHNGSRCPFCNGGTRKWTNEYFSEIFIPDTTAVRYELIETIKNSQSRVSFFCSCGHRYTATISNFIYHGSRCPLCNRGSNGEAWSNEHFARRFVPDIHAIKYELIEDITNGMTKVRFFCTCGNVYKTTVASVIYHKTRCPKCSASKGETKIYEVLMLLKRPFETQKTFPTCRDKGLLKFDFYLPNNNLVIEFHGAQHYKPVDFSHSKTEIETLECFNNYVRRDIIKAKWCEENNVSLLIIKYTEMEKIEQLIKSLF